MKTKLITPKAKEAASWIKTIAVAFVIYIVLTSLFFELMVVHQTSMYPTIKPSDRVGVIKCAYWFDTPSRGDVVIVNITPSLRYIKRVIGRGGESIEIKNSVVYLNGSALKEDYLPEGLVYPSDYPKTTIPQGCCFVMGDNRTGSVDSRDSSIGMINYENVIGRVAFRLLPFTLFWRNDLY